MPTCTYYDFPADGSGLRGASEAVIPFQDWLEFTWTHSYSGHAKGPMPAWGTREQLSSSMPAPPLTLLANDSKSQAHPRYPSAGKVLVLKQNGVFRGVHFIMLYTLCTCYIYSF